MTANDFYQQEFSTYMRSHSSLSMVRFAEAYHTERLKEEGYAYYDGQLFPVGSKLTSKENGELIIAPPGTPEEEIVGIVE